MNASPTSTPTAPAPAATRPVPSFLAGKPITNTVEQVGPPKSFNLFGDTGTEKTRSIGELFKAGFYHRVFFANLDDGTEVLTGDKFVRDAMKDGRFYVHPINVFDPTGSTLELEAIILEMTGNWRAPDGSIVPNPNIPDFGYDMFAIDTVNLMHEIALKHFERTTYNDAGTKLDGLKAYARVAVWMDEMLRLIHNSKRFTGAFLMHAKSFEDKATGISKIKPKMSGSFKDSIASISSITAYLDYEKDPDTEEVVLTATTGQSDLFDVKNRYNLPPKMYGWSAVEMYRQVYTNIGKDLPPEAVVAAPAPITITNPASAPAAA